MNGVPQVSALGPILWNIMYVEVLELKLPEGACLVGLVDDWKIFRIPNPKKKHSHMMFSFFTSYFWRCQHTSNSSFFSPNNSLVTKSNNGSWQRMHRCLQKYIHLMFYFIHSLHLYVYIFSCKTIESKLYAD